MGAVTAAMFVIAVNVAYVRMELQRALRSPITVQVEDANGKRVIGTVVLRADREE